jgi:hypothetical protein
VRLRRIERAPRDNEVGVADCAERAGKVVIVVKLRRLLRSAYSHAMNGGTERPQLALQEYEDALH